jgi:hypothetical protein
VLIPRTPNEAEQCPRANSFWCPSAWFLQASDTQTGERESMSERARELIEQVQAGSTPAQVLSEGRSKRRASKLSTRPSNRPRQGMPLADGSVPRMGQFTVVSTVNLRQVETRYMMVVDGAGLTVTQENRLPGQGWTPSAKFHKPGGASSQLDADQQLEQAREDWKGGNVPRGWIRQDSGLI